MDVTPLIPQGKQVIDAYGDGGFRVSGMRVEGSVIVFPDRLFAWSAAALAEVTAATLDAVKAAGMAGQVDLLLLGTGSRMAQIDRGLRQDLRVAGVVIEVSFDSRITLFLLSSSGSLFLISSFLLLMSVAVVPPGMASGSAGSLPASSSSRSK